MSSATFVVDAPRAPTEVALPQLAPEGKVSALAPVTRPQATGDVLFTLAHDLDRRMHGAATGHGTYTGKTLPEWIAWSGPISGTAACIAGGAAACLAVESHIVLFIMGVVATGVSLFPVNFGLDAWAKRKRAIPVPVEHAQPMLEAFKKGDLSSQTMVVWQAERWSGTFSTNSIDGQELRQQLAELAAVAVPADDATKQRIDTIGSLVAQLPRRRSDAVDCAAITTNFRRLEGEDPTRVGALLLKHLFKGEQLRVGKADKAAVQALYSMLLATQPRNVTSREALQQLVAAP